MWVCCCCFSSAPPTLPPSLHPPLSSPPSLPILPHSHRPFSSSPRQFIVFRLPLSCSSAPSHFPTALHHKNGFPLFPSRPHHHHTLLLPTQNKTKQKQIKTTTNVFPLFPSRPPPPPHTLLPPTQKKNKKTKTRFKASHSCRTTCERSESAQESGE